MQFHVQNMTCGSCARHVTQAITAIDAEAKIEVSVAEKRITVDSSVASEAIQAALGAAGYPASPL